MILRQKIKEPLLFFFYFYLDIPSGNYRQSQSAKYLMNDIGEPLIKSPPYSCIPAVVKGTVS
jgi:hypothetical protein